MSSNRMKNVKFTRRGWWGTVSGYAKAAVIWQGKTLLLVCDDGLEQIDFSEGIRDILFGWV